MLEPNSRRHLFESLRPPLGYELDRAVATTYSLDLLTLLAAPLAFTMFDWENNEGRLNQDPMALLEAIRRFASRISIFCQAGKIAVPRRSQPLFAQLEDIVFEAMAPNEGGVFHPKLWVLRFISSEGPVRYRVLCLTRNLTFDRSWDTVLALEGDLVDRKKGFGPNRPLSDFIKELPKLALRPLPKRTAASLKIIEEELRRVYFELPQGFEAYSFFPLGIDGYRGWPFRGRIDRMMVISPFLTKACLERIVEDGRRDIVISRLESLSGIEPASLEGIISYVLSSAADPEQEDVAETEPETIDLLSGLHAKLYIADSGWNSRLWTGSANATNAAFNGNVEFLVELSGKKSRCGIEALFNSADASTGFGDLLQEFTPSQKLEPDSTLKQLDQMLEQAQRTFAKTRFVSYITSSLDADTFNIQLIFNEEESFEVASGVKVKCWPIMLHESSSKSITEYKNPIAEFKGVTFEALTSFWAFELMATRGEKSRSLRFVLNIPLLDEPSNRKERMLHSLFSSKDQFLRFLLFLLSEGGADIRNIMLLSQARLSVKSSTQAHGSGLPLFEVMVRALDQNPFKIDHIARLVADLRKTPEGCALLPDGFEAIWNPIRTARERQKR